MSLTYNKNYLVGVPEQELTELILQQDWDLYRILYITNGTKKELEEYDYLMMDIGYASSPGDVKRYHATLADIMHKQNKSIMTRMKKSPSAIRRPGLNLRKTCGFSFASRGSTARCRCC